MGLSPAPDDHGGRSADAPETRHPMSTAPSSRRFWLLLLVLTSMLGQFSVNMVRPATTYKVDALGGDAAMVGLVAACYAVVPLVTAMPVGRFIQRRRTLAAVISGGLLLMAAGAVAIALAPAIWGVLLGSAVLGFGQLAFAIGGQSGVTRTAGPAQIDAAFGWFTAGVSAGQMLGPPAAGWIMSTAPGAEEGIDRSIMAGAAAALPAAVVLLLALLRLRTAQRRTGRRRRDEARTSAETRPAGTRPAETISTLSILRRPQVGSHMVASAGLLALTDLLVTFMPLLGQRAGLSPTEVGVLLALRGFGSLASRTLLGTLVRRIPRQTLLIGSLILSAGCFVGVPISVGQLLPVGALMVAGGFFLGFGQPLTMTMVTAAVPDQARSPALALRLVGNRLGQVAMPAAAGALAGPVGPGAALWLGAAVLLVSGADQARHRRRGG